MPLYDYKCPECNKEFTEIRKSSERDEPVKCPECGKMESKRMLSGFSIGVNSGSESCSACQLGSQCGL